MHIQERFDKAIIYYKDTDEPLLNERELSFANKLLEGNTESEVRFDEEWIYYLVEGAKYPIARKRSDMKMV